MNSSENLLTVDELSRKLKVPKSTIYIWSHKKAIPVVRISRKMIRFKEREIDDWLNQK